MCLSLVFNYLISRSFCPFALYLLTHNPQSGPKVHFLHSSQQPMITRRHSEKPCNFSVIDLRRSSCQQSSDPIRVSQQSPSRHVRKLSDQGLPRLPTEDSVTKEPLDWSQESVVRILFPVSQLSVSFLFIFTFPRIRLFFRQEMI